MDYIVIRTERGAPMFVTPMSKCIFEFSTDGKMSFFLDNGKSGVIEPTAGGFIKSTMSGHEAIAYATSRASAKDSPE